ncbi:MAG: transglutaminaseTgpA domain-containing protein, partial [Actinomycetota bacterium]
MPRLTRPAGRERDVPEESKALRTAVGLAALFAVAGVLAQDVVTPLVGGLVIVATAAGFYVSWKRRAVNQIGVKFALAAALLLAFANFLRQISGASSLDDTRAPLAEIFLWVQTLHSFDQPRRRDLGFSLAASAGLIALGGSMSLDSSFFLFFVPWGLASLAALALSHLSEVRLAAAEAVRPSASFGKSVPRARGLVRPAAASIAIVLLAGSVVFLFAPRGRGAQVQSLPFDLKRLLPLPEGATGVVNTGLPNSGGPAENPATPDPDTYFGFANFVDLRTRGTLSDDIVMRVRAPQPAFWRGPVFDTYEQSAWTVSSDEARPVSGFPVPVFAERESRIVPTVEMVQTYYVERAQSNVVFAAYRPAEVWFPGGRLDVTDTRALRAGFILDEGLVYSVVSEIPAPSASFLERITVEGVSPEVAERYTQLPPDLPQRVRDLAREIAGDEPTIMGKARAIERWLADNTQ